MEINNISENRSFFNFFPNFAVAILKIIIGNQIKSYSMTADGFHSLSDGASNIVGLIGIFFASKP
ncbi:cation transporter, partial [Clostridioides difficile]